jgi:uncharacterized protein
MSRELTFDSERQRLAGRVFSPPDRPPSGGGILFIHGLGSHQGGYRPRAEATARRLGAIGLTFDLSGHGESTGSAAALSPRDHLADCLAAFELLVRMPGVDGSRIGICAASYGAFLTALLIADRSPASTLLRAPALYPDSHLDLPGESKTSSYETPETAVVLGNVAAYDGPILFVESENDETVPHETVATYLGASGNPRVKTMPAAGHRLSDERSKALFIEIIVEWFGATLTGHEDG